MKLDRKDRFIIANQLKILEALYPEEAGSYAIQRTAFEDGYESHYSWAMEHISENTLSEEETKEVVDTLDMFRAIRRCYAELPDKTGIDEYSVKFRGYDGNDRVESKLLGYARYFVVELNRFQEVLEEQGDHFDFNSHGEMRGVYQRMLDVWKRLPPEQRHRLTKDQIVSITQAQVHPENRS